MTITVNVSLSIGISNAAQEDTFEIEVPDNWREMPADDRAEHLDEYWKEWSNNYIDGYIEEAE